MLFLYGVLSATAAIVAAEIAFNYGLGDKVKDGYYFLKAKVLGLFGKGKAAAQDFSSDVKGKF